MTDTDRAFELRVANALRAKVAQLPAITLNVDAVSMSPAESPRRRGRGRVLVAATVLIVVATGFVVTRSADDSGSHPAGPTDAPVVARLELEARPTLSFQAAEFTTIAGVNQITLVPGGGTEAVQFDDPELSAFRLSVPNGPSVGTADLQAGRDYRIHSIIPGHAQAGVDAVIHVLPAGAPGTPPLPAALLDAVSQQSQSWGGPAHGDVEYALSTRDLVNQSLMQAEIPRDHQPVYVFVLHGSFSNARAQGFSDAPSDSTTTTSPENVLTLVVSADPQHTILDSGIAASQPDLAVVGGAISTRY